MADPKKRKRSSTTPRKKAKRVRHPHPAKRSGAHRRRA